MNKSDYEEVLRGVAKRIRGVRERQKITVQELAYRCEMERSNVSRIESGRVNITIKTLCLIASALNVSLEELVVDRELNQDS